MDLRLLRVSKRITATQVGEAMGVTRARVSQIESQLIVKKPTIDRYFAALAVVEAAA
jgi:transcriptional regulator with XRE-family HTH domain